MHSLETEAVVYRVVKNFLIFFLLSPHGFKKKRFLWKNMGKMGFSTFVIFFYY